MAHAGHGHGGGECTNAWHAAVVVSVRVGVRRRVAGHSQTRAQQRGADAMTSGRSTGRQVATAGGLNMSQ